MLKVLWFSDRPMTFSQANSLFDQGKYLFEKGVEVVHISEPLKHNASFACTVEITEILKKHKASMVAGVFSSQCRYSTWKIDETFRDIRTSDYTSHKFWINRTLPLGILRL